MLKKIIDWSLENRFLVLVLSLAAGFWGLWAVKNTPLDALPDLSDVQVIIKTSWPGQAPQVMEDQVTYPLTTAMLSVPKATTVRGYSFFGDSYVYVLFEDKTDLYWARSRVLEYLSQVASSLPAGAKTSIGPDATGIGWVFEYALVDRSGGHDLGQLRAIQDWYLKYELQTVPGVSEVASIGGMVKQYRVVVDPKRLQEHGIPLSHVKMAIQQNNAETGGAVVEMAEAEYMVRATGYIQKLDDLKKIVLKSDANGTPVTLADVAHFETGPQLRRGIAELDGEGEVAGAVVLMRYGENALTTIENIKAKLAELQKGLPEGVEIVTTYDRSKLINRAVDTLRDKLIEEFIVVALVCAVFLFHLRSALVIVLSLPLGILLAFIVMQKMGMSANIMSLGGIAIAIGAMVDAAIVMLETAHKRLEQRKPDESHWHAIALASKEVGPALFFSLLIITLSFMPVFSLEAQEGRLFSPLAYTKTFAMAGAALLSITLVPVLMGLFVRGKITPEHKNPVNRFLVFIYRPFINLVLKAPKTLLVVSLLVMVSVVWPWNRLGSEFMPELDEGDLLYMPTTFPAISTGKAQQLLQITDKLIKTVPEVERVFGKVGRADSATDPAPLTMIETTILLKPRDQWRPGMTMDKLKRELDQVVKIPGVTNAWVMPIKNRIDMLATGIKTPVGVKVAGDDLAVIEEVGKQIERIVQGIPGTVSVYSERVTGGRYITVDIDRDAAARYGASIKEIQGVVSSAIGGMNVSQSIEGRERYPINVRYPQNIRDSVEDIRNLPVVTQNGQWITLADVADIRVEKGPGGIKTENARLNGWTFIDIEGRDLGSYVDEARQKVFDELDLPAGYSVSWSGQFEYMQRANKKLAIVVPVTLLIIALLLYLHFKRFSEVLIILGTLPLALVGGIWAIYLLGYNLSVAVGVGFIALAGVAVEIGVVMLVYLNQALKQEKDSLSAGEALDEPHVRQAIINGALKRVRPIAMTVTAIIAGLLPIMLGTGTGSEVMRRIAAPMVGGMISATLLTLLLLPAVFYLWKRHSASRYTNDTDSNIHSTQETDHV